ncbi:phosphatase PAP2 family protein [Terrimonas alba]|uniref:phosphatase PAP2 family protein n=1 Tax=Terrimonas alba TaxID=3349636 RepID=UPI0035F31E26
MKRCILNSLLLFNLASAFAQGNSTNGTPIIPDHYKKLQALDSRPDLSRHWLDTLTFPAREITTSVLAATKMRTVYLVEDVPSLLQIPAPPANSSVQTAAELKYLLELQTKRTDEDVRRYKNLAGIFHSPNNFNPFDPDYDRNFSSLFHIGSPMGEWYTYKNLPVTAGFLSDVYRDATYYFFKLKFLFNRARPYMLESKIKYLERPPHPSYPNGHSAASYVNAYIMIRIDPTLSNEFLKMAAEMAYSREVIGVHYPSDSEAGKVWALQFVEELFKTEKFRQDFNKAKAEILEWQSKNKSTATEQEKQCSSSCDPVCSESCNAPSSCCNQ